MSLQGEFSWKSRWKSVVRERLPHDIRCVEPAVEAEVDLHPCQGVQPRLIPCENLRSRRGVAVVKGREQS